MLDVEQGWEMLDHLQGNKYLLPPRPWHLGGSQVPLSRGLSVAFTICSIVVKLSIILQLAVATIEDSCLLGADGLKFNFGALLTASIPTYKKTEAVSSATTPRILYQIQRQRGIWEFNNDCYKSPYKFGGHRHAKPRTPNMAVYENGCQIWLSESIPNITGAVRRHSKRRILISLPFNKFGLNVDELLICIDIWDTFYILSIMTES